MNTRESNPFEDLGEYKNPNETRYFNKFTGKEDTIGTEPYFVPKKEIGENPFEDLGDGEPEEGWGKWAFRTASQVPQGIASAYTYPLDLISLVGSGLAFDPNTIEELRFASEKAGIPFDENEYMQAVQNVSENVPTQSNIARKIEESTGIPLVPKTGLQKLVNFASMASTLSPKDYTFRGMNTALPRPILGTGVALTAEAGKALGVPEPIADIASFGILKKPTTGAGSLDIGTPKTKQSGLPERRFEDLTKEREVSQGKIDKINSKLKNDFKTISDKIIKDSPVGETASELLSNPAYIQESRELLGEAKKVADTITRTIPQETVKKELSNIASKQSKGFLTSEYDREYTKYMLEAQDQMKVKDISPSQLVEQYRVNNGALSEYFEPGSSKALNRAKRDAILDQNRAIAEILEKHYPESNLSQVFKEGNERWTKIKDLQMVDEFVNEMFKDGVNYKKMHDFFDRSGFDRQFKKALGEKGYKDFEQLMKDMLLSEKGYGQLKVAKSKGYDDLVKIGIGYVLHPKIALTKGSIDLAKQTFKTLMNTLLDKPKLSFTYKKAVNDLKAGNFKEAEKGFKTLNEAVKPSEIVTPKKTTASNKVEPIIEAKVEPMESGKTNANKQDALGKFNERKNKVEAPETKKEAWDNLKMKPGEASAVFYEKSWDAIQKGESSISGIKEPFLDAAKKEIERGSIKSLDDLKKYGDFYFGLKNEAKANPKPPVKANPQVKTEVKSVKQEPKQIEYKVETKTPTEAEEFRDRFMNQPRGIDQRSYDADKARKALAKEPEIKPVLNPKPKVVSKEAKKIKGYQSDLKNLEKSKEAINNQLRYKAESQNYSQERINNLIEDRKNINKRQEQIKAKIDKLKNPEKLIVKEEVKPKETLPESKAVKPEAKIEVEKPLSEKKYKEIINDITKETEKNKLYLSTKNRLNRQLPSGNSHKEIKERIKAEIETWQEKLDVSDKRLDELNKAKMDYPISEKELADNVLKLKKELNETKGNTRDIRDKKSDIRDEIEMYQKAWQDLVTKRRRLEKSIVEKSKASVNKFSNKDLKNQKDYIINAIDQAIAKPTNKEFVTIHVPDDGTFKIYNIEDILNKFKDKVKKSYPVKQLKSNF